MIKSKAKPNLKNNIIYNIFYRITTIVIPLITIPYVSRVLGAENIGIYSYTYTVAQWFMIFGLFGFENYGNRQIAMVRDDQNELNRTFSALYGLQLFSSGIAVLSYLAYVFLFCKQYMYMSVLSSLYVFSTLLNISWLFFGMEQFKTTAIRTIVARFLGLLLILAFVNTKEDLWLYVMILSAMELLNQAVLWFKLDSMVKFVRVGFADVKKHINGCAILFLPIVLINIYRMMDKLMLGNMSTMSETGFYTYADKIVEVPFHLITAIGVVMLPRVTNLVANGEMKKSLGYIETTLWYNSMLGCAFCFGMIAVSQDFTILFLGSEYSRSVVLINIIAPMIIFRAWANVIRTQFLIPNHRDKEYIVSLVVGVIFNLVFNFIMIPIYGAAGAAGATLGAESLVAILQIWASRDNLPIKKYLKSSLPFLVFGIIMVIMVKFVRQKFFGNWQGLLVQVIFGGSIYLTLTIIYLMHFDREQFGVLRRHLWGQNKLKKDWRKEA